MYTQIATLIGFVVLSALFSGLETAFVSINPIKARALRDGKNKFGSILYNLKQKQRKVIIAILIGNNLVNIGSSAYATYLFTNAFGHAGVGIATGIMTFLILTFGEILPKTYFAKHATQISLMFAKFLQILIIILSPFIWFFERLADVCKISEVPTEVVSEKELQAMIDVGAEEAVLHKKQKQFMKSVFEFDDTKAKEIMTPRVDIFALEESDQISEKIKQIKIAGFSRIPVYKEHIDQITGYIHIRDLIGTKKKDLKAKDLSNKIQFISGEKIIQELFTELQKKRKHIAIVVDEHGGTDGVVTMEDILEELVGEIMDESDTDELYIKKLDKNNWSISGDATIDDINEELKIKLPENEHYPTISGYIQNKINDLPEKDEEIIDKRKKIKMKVTSVKNHTIESVKISKL